METFTPQYCPYHYFHREFSYKATTHIAKDLLNTLTRIIKYDAIRSGQSSVIDVIGRTSVMLSIQKLLVAAFLLDHLVLKHFVKRYRSAIL